MSMPCIAIATGDPAGIGLEIALKAALDSRVKTLCRPLLVHVLKQYTPNCACRLKAPKVAINKHCSGR